MLTGRGRYAIHPLFITAFMNPDTADRQRIEGCGGCYLAEKSTVAGCKYIGIRYYPGIDSLEG
jgi:hypothetical protein